MLLNASIPDMGMDEVYSYCESRRFDLVVFETEGQNLGAFAVFKHTYRIFPLSLVHASGIKGPKAFIGVRKDSELSAHSLSRLKFLSPLVYKGIHRKKQSYFLINLCGFKYPKEKGKIGYALFFKTDIPTKEAWMQVQKNALSMSKVEVNFQSLASYDKAEEIYQKTVDTFSQSVPTKIKQNAKIVKASYLFYLKDTAAKHSLINHDQVSEKKRFRYLSPKEAKQQPRQQPSIFHLDPEGLKLVLAVCSNRFEILLKKAFPHIKKDQKLHQVLLTFFRRALKKAALQRKSAFNFRALRVFLHYLIQLDRSQRVKLSKEQRNRIEAVAFQTLNEPLLQQWFKKIFYY